MKFLFLSVRDAFVLNKFFLNLVFLLSTFFLSVNVFSQTADFKVQHLQDDVPAGGTTSSFTPVSSLNNAVALANTNRKTHAGSPSSAGILEGDDLAGARQLTATNTLTYYREGSSVNKNMRFNTSIWEYIGPSGGANPTTPIAANSSTTFTIEFNPSAAGVRTASVSIANNDANENPYNFNIQGTGVAGPPTHTIYYENFNANNGGWSVSNPGGSTTTWVYGTNANLDATEGNHWYTSDYGSYADYTHTYVTSPVIDLTNFNNLVFKIDLEYNTEADWDGINIEYSINGGTSWSILGNASTPTVNNWYNDTDVDAIGIGVDGWSGSNPHNSTSPSHSNFFEASIALPSSLNDKANVKFRIQFASDAYISGLGANFDNVIIQGDYINPVATPSTAPGGVTSNLKLWLKANSGTSTSVDGATISTWSDEAYDNDAKAITTKEPTFYNNPTKNINFNPVVNFNKVSKQEMIGKGGYYSQDYFIIVKPIETYNASTPGQQVIAGKFTKTTFAFDGTGFAFGKISARYTNALISHSIGTTPGIGAVSNTSYGRAYESNADTVGGRVMLLNVKTNLADNSTEIYLNGYRIDNATGKTYDQNTNSHGADLNFREFTNLPYYLGTGRFTANGHAVDGHFNGDIAEFFSYSVKNSESNRIKIQSSLAIKYGITLNNTSKISTETNVTYRNSNNDIIWSPTADGGGFNFDIAGIGRDDAASLNQKQSKTINTADDITIGLGSIAAKNSDNANTFATDNSYLVWGNDHGDLTASVATIADISGGVAGLSTPVEFQSFNRKWKIVSTGTVGKVTISLPSSMITPTLTPPTGGDYLMFISDTPSFNPSSEYRVMSFNGANLEAKYTFSNTKYITFGYAPKKNFVRAISFDGINDYLLAEDVLDLNASAFTISTWVKRASSTSSPGDYTILSKAKTTGGVEGYQLKITNGGKCSFYWDDGAGFPGDEELLSNTTIPENEWHHITVTYDGTNARMYIDGVLDNVAATHPPVVSNQHFCIGAIYNDNNASKFFKGSIDEIRIWDIALNTDQIRYLMNQEIEKNGINAQGTYLNNIPTSSLTKNSSIPWSNLQAYYPMSNYTYTNTKDESDNNYTVTLKNLNTVDYQTAPIPYKTSGNTTDWNLKSTWLNGANIQVPGTPSIVSATTTIDWNIVETNHDITMDNSSLPAGNLGNRTLLALNVKSGKLTLTGDNATNTGNGLTITHYLKLMGSIDLNGDSQLIQTTHSDLDVNSTGFIEKDQQGTQNSFTYNYWSSPVSKIGAGNNNVPFKIIDILKDGTNVNNYETINFETGTTQASVSPYYADGALTSPIKIAKYWMYTYNPSTGWKWAGENAINVTDGFSMKGTSGSGAIINNQNYTFIGKPNNVLNGDTEIVHTTLPVPADPANSDVFALTGNPFPSAIDGDKFIKDNLTSTDGQLYFWEHWGGGSHIQGDYQGGYAIYTIAGGVRATIHPDLNTPTGNGTKIPKRYIPVAQGFYVIASATGGNVVFKNSQRAFQKENGGGASLFLKTKTTSKTPNNTSSKKRIWLGVDTPNGYHRQVLAAFLQGATDDFDKGYDGKSGDILSNDAFFIQNDTHYVIQAFGEFDEDREIPITVIVDEDNNDGIIKFRIDKLENIADDINIYIKDNETGETHDIRNQPYEVSVSSGEHKTRFSLVFKEAVVLNVDDITSLKNKLAIYVDQHKDEIVVKNSSNIIISKITLTNYLGQTLYSWSTNLTKESIRLPYRLPLGIYLVNCKSKSGNITKKVVIK